MADRDPGWARATLRQAINVQGGLWSASRAHALLAERGWRSESERPVNVVGNLLAAMERDGEIKRTGRGVYTWIGPVIAAGTEPEFAAFRRQMAQDVMRLANADQGMSWSLVNLVEFHTETVLEFEGRWSLHHPGGATSRRIRVVLMMIPEAK